MCLCPCHPSSDLHESGCAAAWTSARRAFRCLQRERDVAAGTGRSTITTVVSGNDALNSSLHNESPVSASGCGRCSRNVSKHTPQTHAELCNPVPLGTDDCFDRHSGCFTSPQNLSTRTRPKNRETTPCVDIACKKHSRIHAATKKLKGLVQAPRVTKELHHDAEREVGGRMGRRSHHVQESQTLVHVLLLRTNVYVTQIARLARRSYLCLGHNSWPEAVFSNAFLFGNVLRCPQKN